MKKTLLLITLFITGVCFAQKYEGMEFYDDGKPKYIKFYKVSKDKIELVKEIEWNKGGQKIEEGIYKDGKEDGLWTYWHSNGKKLKEINFKNGEPHGKLTKWWYNGKKRYEETYKDGKLDGLITRWYENGQKKEEETYKDGKRDGLHTTWYQDGRKESEEKYVDGSTDCSFESFGGEELVVNKVITQIVKGLKNISNINRIFGDVEPYPNNPFETSYELPECYIETNESRKDGYWWFSNDTIHYGLKYKWIYDSDSGTITKL